MSEKKKLDSATKKAFTKSLAVIQKSPRSISSNEQRNSTNTSTVTELLTEFLTSIMTKDYEQALVYCTQILCAEPKNTTAREFYPLIVEKLDMLENEDSSDSSTTSDSSLSSSSSDNIFFNKSSGIVLKKSEDSLQQLSEEEKNLGKKKITNSDKNVAISSSVPFVKTLKSQNTRMLDCSTSYKKATIEEPFVMNQSNRSAVLVHPTNTITLAKSGSNLKEQNQIEKVTGSKYSRALLHTSPTVTLSRSPPSNETNIENS